MALKISAAEPEGPLAHAPQTHSRSTPRCETSPVVYHLRDQVALLGPQDHPDAAGPGVLPGVGQRLPGHARELHPGVAEGLRGEPLFHLQADDGALTVHRATALHKGVHQLGERSVHLLFEAQVVDRVA